MPLMISRWDVQTGMTENRERPRSVNEVTSGTPALEPGTAWDVPDTIPTEWLRLWPASPPPGGGARRGRRRPIRIIVALNHRGSAEAQEVATKLVLASNGTMLVFHIRELGPYVSYLESSAEANSLVEA